jgi:hypothetical protein
VQMTSPQCSQSPQGLASSRKAMKTAGRENPNHGVTLPRDRAHGAVGQNTPRSIKWAAK